MSNKTLNASVKLNTKSAEASLTRLTKKINAVQKAITKTGNNAKLTKALNNAVTATNKLTTSTNKWAAATNKVVNTTNKVNTANQKAISSAQRLGSAYQSSASKANGLLSTVKKLASTYLGVMGMKAIIDTSDTITSAENRFNNLEGGSPELTQASMDKIYAASQRSRSGYGDMLGNVSKSMTLAGDAFQGNIDNAIKFQEIMAKAYTVGGASAAEQSSSMYQLVQALGAGVLQGDELRSVREGAPLAYKAIEEFCQGVLNTDESLKDLASQGVITSNMVVAAIMDMENGTDNINDKFANTQMTFAQAWESIKNTAIKAFEPVLQMLNNLLNSDLGRGLITGIGNALLIVANIILWLANLVTSVVGWIAENWNWLSRVILTILSIVGIVMAVVLFPKFIAWLQYIAFAVQYYLWLGATAVASALKTAAAWAIAHWPLLLIIIIIIAVVAAIIWLSDSFADACGMISGVILATIAFIWNLIVGVLNAIIQLLWSAAEPFIGIIEWILNCCNGGFNSFGDAVANLIGNIIGWFLSLGQVVTKIIDAIFGTNWTGGLEELKGKVTSWGKNENAITISREAPTIDRWAYSDAYSTGYDWGYSSGEGISSAVSGIGDFFSDPASSLDANNSTYALGDSYDPTGANDDINKALKEIGGDTGDIADSMELTSEDLEYLRRIADMEWKKEFTTASITVDMSNYNTINGDGDLDGIVDKLADKLYDEMNAVANGVYE